MDENKRYRLKIDPAILKLLGPSLYTNVYYVLAELIANAWDADAQNVYIIDEEDKIIVEDDGIGMSYSKGGVQKYLNVAQETRTNEQNSLTPSKRIKMGRKGIGKLSALAVSKNVKIMTISNGEKSGFILSREIPSDGELVPIPENEIEFYKITDHGTSIQMNNPEYKLNKGIDVIKRNISKMFPVISEKFRIHITKKEKTVVIDSFDKTIISDLASLITIGNDYEYLKKSFDPRVAANDGELVKTYQTKKIKLRLLNNANIEQDYTLKINGWIGAYQSTKNRKTEVLEFQDNFLSLYSHGKLGEFNILPKIGQNRLHEVYVVGQLHVDLFEETTLPDMALSNRQGYKDDDKRYEVTTAYAQELLKEIIDLRIKWASIYDKKNKRAMTNKKRQLEEQFKEDIVSFERNVTSSIVTSIFKNNSKNISSADADYVKKIVQDSLNQNRKFLDLKPVIDSGKKRILISQTKADKDLSDVIYEMLVFNGVSKEEIIYTNSDDQVARIPEEYSIFEYLRTFFVDSVSNKKMYVIYVTSEDMGNSWGAVVEVGANWITQMDHKIFNINSFVPRAPLNVSAEWHQTYRNGENNLEMDFVGLDSFCVKIEKICEVLGYNPNTREKNIAKLKTLVIAK